MSDSTAIFVMLALFFGGMPVYAVLDRTYQNQLEAVATGMVRGVRVTASYRQFILYTRLIPFIGVVVSPLAFGAIGWMLLARELVDEDVRLAAQLAAYLHAAGVLGWLSLGTMQVFYFRSLLRQAEAD
jgi:hypothetical protein